MRTSILRKLTLPLFLALLFGLSLMPTAAQSLAPESFGGLKWRLIGPFRGGRAVAVAGVPGDGTTFYFGGVDSGIWKTSDAGVVWNPIFDSAPVGSIGALAVAPSNPKIIYAGTGEADIRSNLASGDGVYKSTDGWPDLAEHWVARFPANQPDRSGSKKCRHRLCGRAGTCLRAER